MRIRIKARAHISWCAVLLLPGLAACALVPKQPVEPPSSVRRDLAGFQIALVADSQFQSKNRKSVQFYRNKFVDLFVKNVAIRPAALEKLAPVLLQTFLDELKGESRPDLLLYLGDAANNGCEDEVRLALRLLDDYRSDTRVPVFFVIGNHDYLGNGNTSLMKHRFEFCNEEASSVPRELNRPLGKMEVMRRLHRFNRKNDELAAASGWSFRYRSNLDTDEELAKCADAVQSQQAARWLRRLVRPPYQHTTAGCFLTGIVNAEVGGTSVEIVLLDTSDYADKGLRYSLFGRGFFGATGWISTEGKFSQLAWLRKQKRKDDAAPALRFLASHYPPDQFGAFWRLFPWTRVADRLGPLYDPEPTLGNHWLYGHTHAQPQDGFFGVPAWPFSSTRVLTYNTGSTTDTTQTAPHTPYVRILTITDLGGVVADERRIAEPESCVGILKRVDEQKIPPIASDKVPMPYYYPVNNFVGGTSLFGLDRRYRDFDWTHPDSKHTSWNLELLRSYLHEFGYSERDVDVCLALLASRLEAGLSAAE